MQGVEAGIYRVTSSPGGHESPTLFLPSTGEHTMIRRIGAVAVIAAFVLLTGHTAEADNATALPQGKSFFEGTWVGKWQSYKNPGDTKDVTLIINKGNAEGVFLRAGSPAGLLARNGPG